jgi:hypothetical protein
MAIGLRVTRTVFFIAAIVFAPSARDASGQSSDSMHVRAAPNVGVFDSRTGSVLPGVQVRDTLTGDYEITTATGTVRLDFITFVGRRAASASPTLATFSSRASANAGGEDRRDRARGRRA